MGAGIHGTELNLRPERKEINQKTLSNLLKEHRMQHPTFLLPYFAW